MVFCLEYNIENVIGQGECKSADIIQILAHSSKQEPQLLQAFDLHIVMNLQFDLQNEMSLQFVLQNEMNHQYDLHFEMSLQCDLHFERNLLFISKTLNYLVYLVSSNNQKQYFPSIVWGYI